MRASFVLLAEHRTAFDGLSDEDAGKLIKAVFRYHVDGEVPDLPPMPNFAFQVLKPVFDRFNERYEDTCRKRREAGSKGGKAKASNAKQSEANLANASKCQQELANDSNAKQTLANSSDRDPDPDPDPDRERDRVSEEKAYCASGDAPEARPKPRRTSVLSGWKLETFNAFWKAYGWMKGRGGAEKAWAAIPNLDNALVKLICDAARREAAQRQAILDAGRTPKWAQGWLNERRWEDDYSQPEQQAHRPYVPQSRQGQYAGMTWAEIRDEKNKQACRDAVREYLADKGIAMEEEYAEQASDEPWTVTVNE